MEPTKVLVVGCGGLSGAMLPLLQQTPGLALAGLVDVRREAALARGGPMGLPEDACYTDLADALRECCCDAVWLNTPSEGHYEQTCAIIAAGKHALVAKPVTNLWEEAVELVDRAADAGVTLSVGQQIRYNRHYTALTQYVASGALGSVEAAWFQNSKPRPNALNLGGMAHPSLYENACHHFDSFVSVFGDRDPQWVFCDGFIPSWSPYSGACMVNALIEFSGGLHLSYHGGFSARAPMYEFRIEGSAGALCCHGVHMSSDTMRYEMAPALGAFAPAEIDADVPVRNPFMVLAHEWKAYVDGGPEPPFSGRNNLRVFAMLSAAIDSCERGVVVEIAGNPRYARAFGGKR